MNETFKFATFINLEVMTAIKTNVSTNTCDILNLRPVHFSQLTNFSFSSLFNAERSTGKNTAIFKD